MRTDKKIGNSVLVHFSGYVNEFFIRNSGKKNFDEYDELLTIQNDTIFVSKEALDKYGIKIKIEEYNGDTFDYEVETNKERED